MEIIHLILGKANPNRMNGVNRVVNELAGRQCQAGIQAQVWGISADVTHNYPARNYSTRLFARSVNPFALSASLQHAIKAMPGAVFHLHGGFLPQMYAAARLLQRCGIPFVFTPHGSYNTIAMQKSSWQKKIYFQLFERRLLNAARAVHALGQSETEGLQQVFPNNKSVRIPYGFEPAAAGHSSRSNKNFITGYCGRMDVYTKGLNELLQGFAAFLTLHPTARLWLIGDGPERAALEQTAASLAITHAVVFWGAKYGEEKNSLLQQCHVFAAPSRNEGLPVAVLEAASLGVPCLVTEATNTGSYIRQYQAGVVIAHTCGTEIKEALAALYQSMRNPEAAATLAANARYMVADAFNWPRIVKAFNTLYQC